MADPIALRLTQKDDLTEIEIRILHPMEPGDALSQKPGSRRPPVFLQSMAIQLNERTLVEGQLSTSLAKNPSFRFAFPGIKTGDKFTVVCADNRDREFRSEILAKF